MLCECFVKALGPVTRNVGPVTRNVGPVPTGASLLLYICSERALLGRVILRLWRPTPACSYDFPCARVYVELHFDYICFVNAL